MPAFLFFVVGQTIFFTWLWSRTRGSLLLMWILHAMVNVGGSLFFVGDQVHQVVVRGCCYALLAVILIVLYGPDLTRRAAQSLVPELSV